MKAFLTIWGLSLTIVILFFCVPIETGSQMIWQTFEDSTWKAKYEVHYGSLSKSIINCGYEFSTTYHISKPLLIVVWNASNLGEYKFWSNSSSGD